MGFYGNINNTTKVQFNFDRIFSSRYDMDTSVSEGADGVFAGRFVLISYEKEVRNFPICYLKNHKLYKNRDDATELTFQAGAVVRVPLNYNLDDTTQHGYFRVGENGTPSFLMGDEISSEVDFPIYYFNNDKLYINQVDAEAETNPVLDLPINTTIHIPLDYDISPVQASEKKNGYYKIDGITNEGIVTISLITPNTEVSNPYLINYLLDTQTYGNGRGYDGTVWQKMYAENRSYFAMVAELNSIVPTLAITADAPTKIPKAPHFDVDTSNVYYKLHIQSMPSAWLKPANSGVEWTVGTDIPNETTGIPTTLNRNYPSDVTYSYPQVQLDGSISYNPRPAAMYFNKAGFDPINIHYAEDVAPEDAERTQKNIWKVNTEQKYVPEDKITIDLNGKSGQLYGVEGSISQTAQPDTYELAIMLPSIGDTMAHVWDLVYGGRNIVGSLGVRNNDIKWEDAGGPQYRHGLRLTKITDNGIGYEQDEVNTIAGSINTVHDLIGMIIVDAHDDTKYDFTDDRVVQAADSDKIYWKNDTYYRVGIEYDPQYDELDASNNKNPLPHFEQTTLNEPTDNTYFDKYGDNYLLIRDTSDFKKNKKYYQWNNLSNAFTAAIVPEIGYEKNKYYYIVGDSYILDKNDVPTPGRQYYQIADTAWQREADGASIIWYKEGRFYKQSTENPGEIILDRSSNWSDDPNNIAHYRLYLIEPNALGTNTDTVYIDVTDRVRKFNTKAGVPTEYYTFDAVNSIYTKVTSDIYANIWADDADNITPEGWSEESQLTPHTTRDIQAISLQLYTLNLGENDRLISLYAPGTYYYVDNPVTTENAQNSLLIDDGNGGQRRVIGDIIKDKNVTKVEGRTYFTKNADADLVEHPFYIENEYYIRDDNNGEVQGDDTPTSHKYSLSTSAYTSTIYYERFDKHVIEDSNDIFPIYYKWNPNIQVPTGVQLCWLKDKQAFEELEGYGRNKNTINGLLLETHKKFGTENTRDVETVNGAINTLQDLTYNFATMEAGQPVLIDNYGRMHSAPMTIDTNDRWLNLVIDSNINSPSIKFSHIGPDASVTHSAVNNDTPGFDETFNIADWTFDSKGHKADGGQHRVKIPGLELVADDTNTSGNVITNLEYAYDNLTAHKGTFTASRMNLGAIPLGSYIAPTGGNGIDTSSTLASALSTLDARIYAEEQARAVALTNAINALDLGTVTNNTTDKTTTFVSSINEVDGVVTYTTQGITAASTSDPGIVQLNDTINSADTDKAATANAVKTAYDLAATKVTANSDITGGTATKITYDAKGLVTAGANLEWNDIKSFVVGKDNGQADITLDDLIAYLVSENSAALTETLTAITVTPPTKTTYVNGETLNLDGMVVTATYRRGAKTEIVTLNGGYTVTPASNIPLTLTSPTVAETQTVTVTHTLTGVSGTFNVTVNPKVMTGIEITSEPTKMNYTDGETLDLEGLEVTASFNDNSTRLLNTSEYVTDPVDSATLTAGDVTVLVSVPNTAFTDSFTVYVV